MIMGNDFSSREAVSPIKVTISIEEPLMGFEMCFWEQNHIYMYILQQLTELIAPLLGCMEL
jgi:hypothetical protein